MLNLSYIKDSNKLLTNNSNEDLELIVEENSNHTTVKVKALTKLELVESKTDT